MKIIKINDIKYKISPNKVFLIKDDEDDKIFIKNDSIKQVIASNPNFFEFLNIEEIVIFDIDSEKIIFIKFNIDRNRKNNIILMSDDGDTRNDCLVYAEKLCILNKTNNNFKKYREFTGKGAKAAFREKNTGLQIGWNDANNFKVVLSQISDKSHYCSINPDIGEAYLLSRVLYNHKFNYELLNESEKTGCPYHTAAVIFKDGENCNITLEADFSDKERTMPVFDMYYAGSDPSFFGDTFYMRFRKLYTIKYNPRFKLPSLSEKHTKSLESSTPREGKDIQPVLLCLYIDVSALRDPIRRSSSRISGKCTQCKTTIKNKTKYSISETRAKSEPLPNNRQSDRKVLRKTQSERKRSKSNTQKTGNK
jgi:hypothetical protein